MRLPVKPSLTFCSYLFSTTSIKISILLFYRRLSVSFTPGFLWATWIGIIYNVLQIVAFLIALLTLCQPTAAYWLSFDRMWALENQGRFHCRSEGISLTMSAVVSIIGDFYAATLPCMLIMRLQMSRKQKIAVGALFAVSYVVVGLGIGRAVMLNRVVMHDYDYTWTLYAMWVWSLLELWIGLLAASAPALKPFVKRFVVHPLRSTVSSSRKSPSYGRDANERLPEPAKRPVRSWNSLIPALAQVPLMPSIKKDIDDGSSLFSKPTDLTGTLRPDAVPNNAPCDVEQGSVPMHTWKNSNDSCMSQDFEYVSGARCWSPASPLSPCSIASAPVQWQHRQHQRQLMRSSAPVTSDSGAAAPTAVHDQDALARTGVGRASTKKSHHLRRTRARYANGRAMQLSNATPRTTRASPPPTSSTAPTKRSDKPTSTDYGGIAIPMPSLPKPVLRPKSIRTAGSSDRLLPSSPSPPPPSTATPACPETVRGRYGAKGLSDPPWYVSCPLPPTPGTAS